MTTNDKDASTTQETAEMAELEKLVRSKDDLRKQNKRAKGNRQDRSSR